MKNSYLALIGMGIFLGLIPSAFSVAFIDTAGGSDSWFNGSQWQGGTAPNGTDAVADFFNGGNDYLSNIFLDVDTSNLTLGALVYRDSGSVNRDLYLETSNGRVLTLDVTSGLPEISARNRKLTIDLVLAGSDGIGFNTNASSTSGTIDIFSANTYSGGTIIDGDGLIRVGDLATLGTGDVTVSSGSFRTDWSGALASTASLTLASGSSYELNFADTMTIAALTVSGNSVGPGTYSVSDLNNNTTGVTFTGTGSIEVIPEPSAFALILLALGALFVLRRRSDGAVADGSRRRA